MEYKEEPRGNNKWDVTCAKGFEEEARELFLAKHRGLSIKDLHFIGLAGESTLLILTTVPAGKK